MDLLGSILGSMDKPPTVSVQEKKAKEAELKRAAEEKKKKSKFRQTIEQKVSRFIQDGSQTRLKFEPMDKIYRSIVYNKFLVHLPLCTFLVCLGMTWQRLLV
jgi:hypothetical protein